jgi:hypothetical protein
MPGVPSRLQAGIVEIFRASSCQLKTCGYTKQEIRVGRKMLVVLLGSELQLPTAQSYIRRTKQQKPKL